MFVEHALALALTSAPTNTQSSVVRWAVHGLASILISLARTLPSAVAEVTRSPQLKPRKLREGSHA
jgi:hypothetical protein